MIAPSSSRNSLKSVSTSTLKEIYGSNDMIYNYYLDDARKKTQESGRNSRPSMMRSAISQSTANDCKPKPRRNTQTSRNWPASKSSYVMTKTVPIAEHSRNFRNFSNTKHFVCSTCQKCVFNVNHDVCVTKLLNEVNSCAKIPTGHRFSIKKTSTVHEKTKTPRSCLRWKPTGRIFKTIGLRWVPTGKIFTSSTTKVDSEPLHGSNADITNPYECIQTLDISANTLNLTTGTSLNTKKERLSVWLLKILTSQKPGVRGIQSDKQRQMIPNDNTSGLTPQLQKIYVHNSTELRIQDNSNELSSSKLVPNVVPPADKIDASLQELDLLFSPMYEEYFTA
ncbi:hypothetical protein Tco_1312250 [Tanacetum coccineum]